jgi:hypothetical protein
MAAPPGTPPDMLCRPVGFEEAIKVDEIYSMNISIP